MRNEYVKLSPDNLAALAAVRTGVLEGDIYSDGDVWVDPVALLQFEQQHEGDTDGT